MLMLDIAVVNTAVPSIARDLHASFQGVQWLVDAYTVALAGTVLTAGSLADRLGRRHGLTLGLAVFTLIVRCGVAGGLGELAGSRAFHLGAAIMFATSFALIRDAYPNAADRGTAFAAYGATIGGSFAVRPLVGGILTSWLDWRAIFLINVPIGLAALTVVRRIHAGREEHRRRIHWTGQTLLVAGLVTLITGLLRGNGSGWGSTEIVALLASAAVCLVAFAVVELRGQHPMLPPPCSATRPSPEPRSRPPRSRPLSSRCSSTRRSTCRTSSGCRRSAPAWRCSPRRSWSSSSPA